MNIPHNQVCNFFLHNLQSKPANSILKDKKEFLVNKFVKGNESKNLKSRRNPLLFYITCLGSFLVPLIRPVLLAAIRPTFLPALFPLATVEALPMCWWLPPPWGCSTGFIATPRTLGQQFLFTLYLWWARPAFKIGLSILPPPAAIPGDTKHLYLIKASENFKVFI